MIDFISPGYALLTTQSCDSQGSSLVRPIDCVLDVPPPLACFCLRCFFLSQVFRSVRTRKGISGVVFSPIRISTCVKLTLRLLYPRRRLHTQDNNPALMYLHSMLP